MIKNIGEDWKGIGDSGKESNQGKKIETIAEKEEIREENLGVRKWTEKDDNKIDNIMDPYYEL